MLCVVMRVDEGRTAQGPRRADRGARSPARPGAPTSCASTASCALVSSRLFVPDGRRHAHPARSLLPRARRSALAEDDHRAARNVVVGIAAVGNVLAVVPAGRPLGPRRSQAVIYAACALGAIGHDHRRARSVLPFAYLGVAFYAVGSGMFLAVDWALMTDIIPKAVTGRFMGMSNVATASAGILALGLGGLLLDVVNRLLGYGSGPRAAFLLAAAFFVLGAFFLRPVDPRRREDVAVPPALPDPA